MENEKWFLNSALDTLHLWTEFPSTFSDTGYKNNYFFAWSIQHYDSVKIIKDTAPILVLADKERDLGTLKKENQFNFTWNPDFESLESMKERFNKELKKYIDNLLAKGNFLKSEKIRKKKGDIFDHFRWLVLYHVGGKSIDFIADENKNTKFPVPYSHQNIKVGIDRALELTGIKLRKGFRGPSSRLKKSK